MICLSINIANSVHVKSFSVILNALLGPLDSSLGTIPRTNLGYGKKYRKLPKIHQILDNYRYINRPPLLSAGEASTTAAGPSDSKFQRSALERASGVSAFRSLILGYRFRRSDECTGPLRMLSGQRS